jgi:hypothetical protein
MKTAWLVWLIITTTAVVLAMPFSSRADWRFDVRIDREMGILDRPWEPPLAGLRTRFELPKTVKPGLPPYDQQPKDATDPVVNRVESEKGQVGQQGQGGQGGQGGQQNP